MQESDQTVSKVTIVLEGLASGQVLITCACNPDIDPDNLTAPQRIATAIMAFVNDMMTGEEGQKDEESNEQPS